MMIYLSFLFSLLLAFFSRLYIVKVSSGWFQRGFSGDSSVHLKIIDACRRRKRKITEYIIPNRMSYPILFHQYCSLFNKDILTKYNYIPNQFLFVAFSGILNAYSMYVFSNYSDGSVAWMGFGVAAIFILSIQNLTAFGPAIAYVKLSSRLMGKLSTSLYFLGLVIYLSYEDYSGFLLSVIMGAIAFLSSTFAAQAIIFVTLVLSLIILSFFPVLVLFFSLSLAVLFSRGYALVSVISMMKYWVIYKKYNAHSRYASQALSRFVSFKDLRDALASANPIKALLKLFFREPIRGIVMYPEVVLISLLLVNDNSDIPLLNNSFALVISTLIVYLVTTTTKLNFLGESYRYIEYCLSLLSPFLMVVFILLFDFSVTEIALIIFLWLGYVFMLSYLLQKKLAYHQPQTVDSLSGFLEGLNLSENDVVFPVTMRLGADIVARTNSKSFWWQPGGITEQKMYHKYIHEYPYLSLNWRALAREHNVNYVIADKLALKNFHDEYDFSGLPILKETDQYIAYSVDIDKI